MLRVALRTDANRKIGGGHLMRSMRLFGAFDGMDVETTIITDEATLSEHPMVKQNFDHIETLSDPFDHNDFKNALIKVTQYAQLDAIIFDHYDLDRNYESIARPFATSLIVLDDMARSHDADILFNYNMTLNSETLWDNANEDSLILHHPCFFPLDEAFTENEITEYKSHPRSIFICFGYDDPKLFSGKILDALCDYPDELSITLIIGPQGQNAIDEIIQKVQSRHDLRIMHQLSADELCLVMRESDIAVGAGGGNIYERAAIGLPSVVFRYADNQNPNIDYFNSKGAIIDAGNVFDFSSDSFLVLFDELLNGQSKREELAINGRGIFGGKPRVYLDQFLRSYIGGGVALRQTVIEDTDFVYSLQDKGTRQFYKNPETPDYEDHKTYMKNRVRDFMTFFIISHQGTDIGMLRFDKEGEGYNVSVAISERYRGKGFAEKAIEQGLNFFPSCVIMADIHHENVASMKSFKNLGFQAEYEDKNFIRFTRKN